MVSRIGGFHLALCKFGPVTLKHVNDRVESAVPAPGRIREIVRFSEIPNNGQSLANEHMLYFFS